MASGFRGKDVVQVIYREVTDVKWLRRYGGAVGDLVFSLGDGSKLEVSGCGPNAEGALLPLPCAC